MKFAKKLYAVIESGMPGTSTPLKNFGINPIKPRNLKDLLLYLLFIKKILYSPRGGLIMYEDRTITISTKCNIGSVPQMSDFLKETIAEVVSFFKEKEYNSAKIQKLQKQIKKIDLDRENINEEIFSTLLKYSSAEITISPPETDKTLGVLTKKVFPFPQYESSFFLKDFIHDLLHYIINPRTATKFNRADLYGGFAEPIGYNSNEFLEEVPALITDFFLPHLLQKDKLKAGKNSFSKIINFKILYKNPGNTASTIRNPLFFNILRYVAFQKQLKKELKTMEPDTIEEIKENPKLAFQKISDSIVKVSWDEILDVFVDYPNFKKILSTTKKIVLHKIKDIIALLSDEIELSTKYKKIKNTPTTEDDLIKIENELEMVKSKRQSLSSIFLKISELNNDSEIKGYYSDLMSFYNNLSKETSYFNWFKGMDDTVYEIFDTILYTTLQSSSNFLQKLDKNKKLQPLGTLENKLNDFLNFVSRAIVDYNKNVTSVDDTFLDDF